MRFSVLLISILSCFLCYSQVPFILQKIKAIKILMKAIVCFNNINPNNGKPDLIGAEELLLKSLNKDTFFGRPIVCYLM